MIVERNCTDVRKMRPCEIILKFVHSLEDSTSKREKKLNFYRLGEIRNNTLKEEVHRLGDIPGLTNRSGF